MTVVALSGGVGGSKLTWGLYKSLPKRCLTVIANTGDDFEHLGLKICPDLDTTLYTLAGIASKERGWGREDETWAFMSALEALGAESWFRIGDRDLALHVERTRLLKAGATLTGVIEHLSRRLGVEATILPMSDLDVPTLIGTLEVQLGFQDYFVRQQCRPIVQSLTYGGAVSAPVTNQIADTLKRVDVSAIIICPSNPYLSIDPILSLAGMRALLRNSEAPVVAVTPIIGGQSVKGPTSKIMKELGVESSALSIAAHYGTLLDGFVLDRTDARLARQFEVPVLVTDTLMTSCAARERLATEVLNFSASLPRRRKECQIP